tara:strand:+ start:5042 stop:6253 length:1212 start_codon:yes stop_codon:yes gene_type:complete
MKKIFTLLLLSVAFISCSSDDDNTDNNNNQSVDAPANYQFTRNGNNTVSYSGQTQRIAMAEELISALKDPTRDQESLNAMFAHVEGDQDFSDLDMLELNASSKNVRSKTAASADYFSSNSTDANAIKANFDSWISSQANDVFPNWGNTASPGNAGLAQELGGSIRYVNEKGLEYNQAFAKSLNGAFLADQICNNYLSAAVLDAGDNVTNNDNDVLVDGKDYTTMEHKWDEAFGYLYGAEEDETAPVLEADSFLSKYLYKVEADSDFTGIADDIYDAFKLGRAAIVAKNYTVRDEQVEILREKISMIIGIRAVYYLQGGKSEIANEDLPSAFHDLSEGFGFIYSLQFTRNPMTDAPYVSKSMVDGYIDTLMEGNGFWDVTPETLDQISEDIAAEFGFTVEQAAN